MSVPAPHFLLFSESRLKRKDVEQETEVESEPVVGHWRFVLESLDGIEKLEADDEEPLAQGDRLELLAVVRGLEALDQPSRVTLVTPSRYVSRGLRFGLEQWRESGWLWERFGRMTPVKNCDLWQRVDRALSFHQVECRTWQMDESEEDVPTECIAEPLPPQPPLQVRRSYPSPAFTQRHQARSRQRAERRNGGSGFTGFCRRLMGKLRSALSTTSTRIEHAENCLAGPHFRA